ncbi:JmjC domain-containing protein E [Diplonema papillatum]|nr:JmjC domain-containing protein E [Diplonema papillatum]
MASARFWTAALCCALAPPPALALALGERPLSLERPTVLFVYKAGHRDSAGARWDRLRAALVDLARDEENSCVEAGNDSTCAAAAGLACDYREMTAEFYGAAGGAFDRANRIGQLLLEAGAVVAVVRPKRPEDHLQCILPPWHPIFFAVDAHALGGVAAAAGFAGGKTLLSPAGRLAGGDAGVFEKLAGALGLAPHPAVREARRRLARGLRRRAGAGGGFCEEIVGGPGLRVFEDFVETSRPVVLRGAAAGWASHAWTAERVAERLGDRPLHVKVAPNGVFEGPEPLSWWTSTTAQDTPLHVLGRLQSPDRVLVRPASTTLPLHELLAALRRNTTVGRSFKESLDHADTLNESTSFYLEYASLAGLGELEDDVSVPDWFPHLQLAVKNIWFGGSTLGKAHFDPYDNLMSVISGKKTFTLFHPHENENMYEGHIREANLEYDTETGRFVRDDLSDTTALTMTPVHINREEDRLLYSGFERANQTRLTCEVGPGDVLYLPAFWWHEVASQGDPFTLATNMWFTPFFTKDFPCASCRLRLNDAYAYIYHPERGFGSPQELK